MVAPDDQAVAVGASDYSKRVTFGITYAKDSILECFEANRTRYPVILPDLMDSPPEELAHLRLHNGTIWRWNRPLIGFGQAGRPHCRIEHRVVAAGPTPVDAIANTALFLGLFEALHGISTVGSVIVSASNAARRRLARATSIGTRSRSTAARACDSTTRA